MGEVVQGGSSRRGKGSRSSLPDPKSGIKALLGWKEMEGSARHGKTRVGGKADGGDDRRRREVVRADEFCVSIQV